ncbi:MAG: phosphopantothenate/pantothenate synthetase [Candidatus Latescibacterota bacterium]|nr:phosphopantothenate/pantothenate synthetase [Candidatus Latescibacterota bacterium]
MTDVPETHPRYLSLRTRDDIVAGVEKGITSPQGLIAHGRGEAYDYLLGEETGPWADRAIQAAAAALLIADRPVISVNGNAAALAPAGLVALSEATGAPLEVNIFHVSSDRELAIAEHLHVFGATEVLLPNSDGPTLDHIDSNRRFVNPEGILKSDWVFVPMEDGDRCEALRKMGKDVITVDLNPLSRTAHTATITIVDNLVRALPRLVESVRGLEEYRNACRREQALRAYAHAETLSEAEAAIRGIEGEGVG